MGNTPALPGASDATFTNGDQDARAHAPGHGLTFAAEHGLVGSRYIQFATRNLNPPSQLYVTSDDGLFVNASSVAAGATVNIVAQLLLPDGRLAVNNFSIAPPSTGTLTSYLFALTEGFLFNVSVQPAPGVRRGQLWLTVALRRGSITAGTSLQTLVQDYVDSYSGPTWPGGTIANSTSGGGLYAHDYNTTTPPNSSYTYAVPSNMRLSPRSVFASFTSSAAVGNRQVACTMTEPLGAIIWSDVCEYNQAASLTIGYSWANALGWAQTAPQQGYISRSLPVISLANGEKLVVGVYNMSAADQLVAVNFAFEQWFTG